MKIGTGKKSVPFTAYFFLNTVRKEGGLWSLSAPGSKRVELIPKNTWRKEEKRGWDEPLFTTDLNSLAFTWGSCKVFGTRLKIVEVEQVTKMNGSQRHNTKRGNLRKTSVESAEDPLLPGKSRWKERPLRRAKSQSARQTFLWQCFQFSLVLFKYIQALRN